MNASVAALLVFLLALLKLGLCLLLLAASLHLLRLGLWSLRQPAPARLPTDAEPLPLSTGELPLVTVQLPMYNERSVAARAIAAACRLDWPRLRIQVLDDSTDDTRQLIDALVAAQQGRGADIRVLRRPDRRGFKAGNLAHGLAQLDPDCAYVAIFDADFVPPPDFLRRLLPILQRDPQLGFVQSRWGYLNEGQNLLTRLQALILDGLMLVEQAYLSAHRLPLPWNGTSGIFRTQALRAAGGWLGEAGSTSVLTEDLDVAVRALLAGYRGRHVAALAVPSELPAAMASFRVQQQRWVGGGAQVLRSLFHKLRQTGPRGRSLLTLLAHLARHARQPYLALALLWLPLLLFAPLGSDLHSVGASPGTGADGGWARHLFSLSGALLHLASLRAGLLLFLLAMAVYYGAARRQAGRSPLAAALLAPLLLPLSMGLCLALSAALLRALFERPEESVFIRTPKAGPGDSADLQQVPTETSAKRARAMARLPLLESAIGVIYVGLAAWACGRGQPASGLSLLAGVALGLLWVGLGSLRRPAG